jgi:hypothetical protein
MSPDGRSLLGASDSLPAGRTRSDSVDGTAPTRAAIASRATDVVFAATVLCISFEQLKWQAATAGRLRLFDILAFLFVAASTAEWLLGRDRAFGRVEAILAIFGVALLLAYLGGAFALETEFSRVRFARGIASFVIHFSLLTAGVAYLVRRPERFYWLTVGYLCAGMAVTACYAGMQLIAAKAGVNLDQLVLKPLTHTPARSLAYTFETGPNIIRVRGLATDPNHLGISLLVPLLTLPSLAARLPRGNRQRTLLSIFLAGFLIIEAATLSRSALLGLAAGLLVLVAYDRRAVLSRVLLLPAASATTLLAVVASQHAHFYRRVLFSRLNAYEHQKGMPGHLELYDYVPRTLHSHPLFGIGLDNFSGFYTSIPRDYGPLSFYVQSLVETGVVGTAIFAAFLGYALLNLWKVRRIGATLFQEANPLANWVRPLGAGLTAALAGTMAANVFYLTMTFAYFYVFLILVLAAPVVFARECETAVPRNQLRETE